MLSGLDTSPAHDTVSAPCVAGRANAIAGVADVAVRSAGIYRRFEPAVAA